MKFYYFIEIIMGNLIFNFILGLILSLKIIILRLLFLREFYLLKSNEVQNELKNI